MDSAPLFAALIGPLLHIAPHLLACAVGLLLCLLRRRELGTAGLYGGLGFGLHIGGSLVGLGGQAWSMWAREYAAAPVSSIASGLTVFIVIATVLHTIAMGLLVAAIVARRPAQSA
ncbi:hypothetical protein [Lysobacter capsici]|uniref:hypothetical protein n=1 Tax=Lysobacter capsici TaxID=435897 RepID=UPI001C0018CE|nr:hypothetical protein [Lysobacter capsici]QWF16787.1 hypothetical protein KME82_24115 [Lysobacter capsici]